MSEKLLLYSKLYFVPWKVHKPYVDLWNLSYSSIHSFRCWVSMFHSPYTSPAKWREWYSERNIICACVYTFFSSWLVGALKRIQFDYMHSFPKAGETTHYIYHYPKNPHPSKGLILRTYIIYTPVKEQVHSLLHWRVQTLILRVIYFTSQRAILFSVTEQHGELSCCWI